MYYLPKKTNIVINELQPFIFINNANIKEKNLFNILLLKYKEKYNYDWNVEEIKKKMSYVLKLNIIKLNIINLCFYYLICNLMNYLNLKMIFLA